MTAQLIRLYLLPLAVPLVSSLALGQDGQRVIELSTRGIPLTGEIVFYKDDGSQIGRPIEVRNERFIWRQLPKDAARFTVKSLESTSPPMEIAAVGHTFATINPNQPLDKSTLAEGVDLKRLPLVETPRPLPPLPTGSQGWVFVGSLATADDLSQWTSLYILNSDDLKKPDKTEKFTFSDLRARVGSTNQTQRLFVGDFPLKIRTAPTNEPVDGASVVRPGQSFEVAEVTRLGKSVFARITVK